jgi:hypothetical protein
MPSPTLSARLKETQPTNADVDALTNRLGSSFQLDADPVDKPNEVEEEESSEDDWEKLADKETDTPVEPIKKQTAVAPSTSVLELYDFEPRTPMHQLVKEFTKIVDPTESMSFRPKMVNQSLRLTFSNPKHGMSSSSH